MSPIEIAANRRTIAAIPPKNTFHNTFTTFSAFSADTFSLITKGDYLLASLYVFGSVFIGFLALVLGIKIIT